MTSSRLDRLLSRLVLELIHLRNSLQQDPLTVEVILKQKSYIHIYEETSPYPKIKTERTGQACAAE